jgi:hypothetical protein
MIPTRAAAPDAPSRVGRVFLEHARVVLRQVEGAIEGITLQVLIKQEMALGGAVN